MNSPDWNEMNFLEFANYYWGETSDVTGELPLLWYDKYEPIEDED